MIIRVILKVVENTISIQAPQTGFSIKIPHSVPYDISTGQPIGIGDTMESMEIENSSNWQKAKPNIGFSNPFSIEDFQPQFIELILEYYCSVIHEKIRKNIFQIIFFFLIDRFDIDLWIPEYEKLADDFREQFEWEIQNLFQVHRISINGKSPPLTKQQFHIIWLTWIGFLFVLYILSYKFIILPSLDTIRMIYGGSLTQGILFLFLFLIILSLTLLITTILGSSLWLLAAKLLVPKNILLPLVKKMNFPKLTNRFFTKIIG